MLLFCTVSLRPQMYRDVPGDLQSETREDRERTEGLRRLKRYILSGAAVRRAGARFGGAGVEGRRVQVEKTKLEGVLLLTPRRFEDARGFFSESWNKRVMADLGLDFNWVQDNHSLSKEPGTVRGLHFQAPPHAQDKLVRCGRGALFDVAVDVRRGSPTYGQWVGYELSSQNGRQLLVPKGFLHGFATCVPDTEVVYKCSDYYNAESDGAVRFDCPEIGIDWNLDDLEPVLSPKDSSAPGLKAFHSPFEYEG